MRRELSRVHEDRDSDFFSALFREPDERHMAVMERTHGRDERERGIALAKFGAGAVKGRQCAGNDGGAGHSYRCLQRVMIGWAEVLTKVVKPANDHERHGRSGCGFIMKMGRN